MSRLGAFPALLASAISAASALRSHRSPRRQDLEAMGIDADAYRKIRRFY